MPAHKEIRIVPFTVKQMYDLVADISAYPEFLPWITQTRVYRHKQGALYADLDIGYKLLSVSYTSYVKKDPHNSIQVHYVQGPMKYLENIWSFKPISETRCEIDFYLNFEFKNPVFKNAMEAIFHEAVNIMVTAFEQRAHQIYA